MDLLTATGPWMIPLLVVGGLLLTTAVRAAVVIGSMEESMGPSGPPHHSVVVWGVLGLVVGLLGTVTGFGRVVIGARAATGAERADFEAMMAVVWDGILIIVTPVTLGLWLLTVSLVLWLGLQFFINRRIG
jgi:hypothetical protein